MLGIQNTLKHICTERSSLAVIALLLAVRSHLESACCTKQSPDTFWRLRQRLNRNWKEHLIVTQPAKQLNLTANHELKKATRWYQIKRILSAQAVCFSGTGQVLSFLAMGVQQLHNGTKCNFHLTHCTSQIIACIQDIWHSCRNLFHRTNDIWLENNLYCLNFSFFFFFFHNCMSSHFYVWK